MKLSNPLFVGPISEVALANQAKESEVPELSGKESPLRNRVREPFTGWKSRKSCRKRPQHGLRTGSRLLHSASPKVSHKGVFTLVRWQPGSANTGFCSIWAIFQPRILGVNSANTLLCDTLAPPIHRKFANFSFFGLVTPDISQSDIAATCFLWLGWKSGRKIGWNIGRNFLGIFVLHLLCRTAHQNFFPH